MSTNTAVVLRQAICTEIQKHKIYQTVALEGEAAAPVLEIQPEIVQFHRGSQAARYFGGAFAGETANAHLGVECKFGNLETGNMIALGMFSGEIASGLFGGSPNEAAMSKYVAQHVAGFLSKGR